MVLLAPSAHASSALWCIGFSDCANKGYSDSQYHQYWGNMYWLMYSGRNCVNYAAFREVEAGMPNVRPWSGSGNAEAWGWDNPQLTNHTPTVGSIAWWRGGAQGAGSLGHVAYVERVLSPTEIVVSESNWGSDFDWRYINTSQNWPTGFIHWTDRPVASTVSPAVLGTPAVDQITQVAPGTWPQGTTLTYQWAADGTAIPGASGTVYRPMASQVGQRLSVTIVASRPGYRQTAMTVSPTSAVQPGTLNGLSTPLISGIVQVGQTVAVSSPQVSPAPNWMSLQWFANGAAIPGATRWTFTPTQDENGAVLTAAVTSVRPGFTPLTTVSGGTIPVVSPPILQNTAGGISGARLTKLPMVASPGTYTPADAAVAYQWLRHGTAIVGATGQTYVPGPADLGQTLGVTVSLTKPKYLDKVTTYTDTAPVKSTSWVVASTRTGENAVQFLVHAAAYGTVTTGLVSVTIAGHRYVKAMSGGFAGFTVTGLPAGNQSFTLAYIGDANSTPSLGGGSVRVLPSSPTNTVIDTIGTVSGPLVAGGTLQAPRVLYGPWDSQITYQWRRDGAPIAGATRAQYRLTHADSGHMITVAETARHQGLRSSTAVFAPVGPVIADPVLTVTTIGGATQAQAAVTVKELGKPATGTITFTSGSQTLTRPLVNGAVSGTLSGLEPGMRTITVAYSGDSLTSPASASATVPVLDQPAASSAAIYSSASVTGRATIGGILGVRILAYAPWGGTLVYQWLRDGKPITGATASSYRVQNLDAGHRLSIRASVRGLNLTPASAVYPASGVITTNAVMGVTATPGASRVTVKVQVSVATLPATGSVRLLLRGTNREVTATLVNGVATLLMTSVPAGRDIFYVVYSGSAAARAMHQTIAESVRR